MTVILRLSRHGAPKRPFYRIIASPKGSKRDSKFLEVVGTYNPMTNPPTVALKEERVKYWIENGAQTSDVVAMLINKNLNNFVDERRAAQRKKIQATRAKRKSRAAAGGKKVAKAAKPAKAKATKKAPKAAAE